MKFVGKGEKLNDLSRGTILPSLPVPKAIKILSFGVFMETYLHRQDGLNHFSWQLICLISSPRRECGTTNKSLDPSLAFSPHYSKAHLINITKDTYTVFST